MSKTGSADPIADLLHEAEEAWSDQDYARSISLIERAISRQSQNPSLHLALGAAHGRRYDYPAADACFERALQVSSNHAETLARAGERCLEFEQVEMAIGYLQRAGNEANPSIGVLITLADIFIRDRRLDEAQQLIERAARINPTEPRVRLAKAVLLRARGNDPEAEMILQPLVTTAASGVPARIRGYYELAGILDRAGAFDRAMSALLEVKAIQRPLAAPFLATTRLIQNRAREMERSITASVLQRWRSLIDQLGPPRRIALLCGHPRSGTTLLEQVLDAHPDIVTAEETQILHDEAYLPLIRDYPEGTSILHALDATPPSALRHARDNYFLCTERFIHQSVGGRLLIDKNPGLNMMIPMVARIFPEVRFLVALRDPRDVVLSCFMQALPLTPISSTYLSLESTVKQYASAMGFWLSMRERLGDSWREIRYEEMVEDLEAVARRTLGFLSVEYDAQVLKFHEHAQTRRVKSPSHAEVVKPVYQRAVGRWKNYAQYLEPYLGGLQNLIDEFKYL